MPTARRSFLTLLAALAAPGTAQAQSPGMSRVTAYAFTFAGLKGDEIRLADHVGKPILIVNTASLCGYTPQYTGLQQLWSRFRDRGLLVVGVPSNDFGGQEPGAAAEIKKTAHGEYGVGFPLAAKAQVKGPSEGRCSRRQSSPVLSLGRRRATARNAALEFPQIPDRP